MLTTSLLTFSAIVAASWWCPVTFGFQPHPNQVKHTPSSDIRKSLPVIEAVDNVQGIIYPTEQDFSFTPDNDVGLEEVDGIAYVKAQSPTFKTWTQRLNTRVDAFGVHKIANLGYVASSTAIVCIGAAVGFETLPDCLEPLTYLFLASTCGQCVSSIRMAGIHRRSNIPIRNIFISTAILSLYQAFISLWIAPFAPPVFDDHFVSASINAAFSVVSLAALVDQMIRIPGVVAMRETKGRNRNEAVGSHWVDVASYMVPLVWVIPFLVWTLFVMGVHDRQWFIDGCLNDSLPFAPHVDLIWAYYAQILITFAPSYGSLFVTLRDKMLITKNAEIGGTLVVSAIAAYSSFHGLGYI